MGNNIYEPEKVGWGAWKKALALAGVAAGAVAATNAAIAVRTPPLGNRLGGTFARYPSRHGDLAYTVAGGGSPVLLLHGLGAGNSMAEWSRNFDALAAQHTVYALDFLGWGLSDKPAQSYLAEDFIEIVRYFAEDVIGEPCAVIASAQSAAFALEAARLAPDSFNRFILICPSTAGDDEVESDGSDEAGLGVPKNLVFAALDAPLVGTGLYNAIVSQAAIERFSKQHLFYDKSQVDAAWVRRYHVAAHQPGAQHAVLSYLTGLLEVDCREAWSQLDAPALLVWGRNSTLNGLETAPEWLALKPDARLEVIDHAMLLPHVEHADRFNELALAWLAA